MERTLKNFILIISSFTFLISCGSTPTVYRPDNDKRISSGTLDDVTHASLRQVLTPLATSSLKDTIIIKYDYNNETCWDLLDQQDDGYIQGFVTRHKQRLQMLQTTRPNVSIFEFREPGSNLNKIKKWNNSIIIDSSRQLMNMLFKARSTCGNSIVILPDQRFVFIRSDSHSEAIDLTQKEIIGYLTKN